MYIRRNFHHIINHGVFVESRRFDNFESQGYEYNQCGFIRNDFSQLQERENQLGFMRALAQMQEYVNVDTNKGKTFEQIVSEIRPRWCQLNGEIDRFEQYCIDNAIQFYKDLKDQETKSGKVASEYAAGAGIVQPENPAVVS